MARRRRPGAAPSGGRIFQRTSRHTGALLPTWWIAYYVDGKQRRESAHTTDLEAQVVRGMESAVASNGPAVLLISGEDIA